MRRTDAAGIPHGPDPVIDGVTLTRRYVRTNGIRLHLVEAGEGPQIVLLHGFPEFWYGWRRQIPFLVEAGFRVIVPDLRGYNRSDRPRGVGSYRLETIVEDVVGLLAAVGASPAVWVGHDWGGAVAWYGAMRHPEAVRRLVVLNSPHPVALARMLRRSPTQLLRFTYAGFFQLPWLPEALLANRWLLRRVLRAGPAPDDEALTRYLEAFPDRASLSGPLNYYRAAVRRPPGAAVSITLPTLVVWGDRDPFLDARLTEGMGRGVEDLRIVHLPHAGHWLHQRNAGEVNRGIHEFLADDREEPSGQGELPPDAGPEPR